MSYNDYTVDKLKSILKGRSLHTSGVKDLVTRLVEDDEHTRVVQIGRETKDDIHRSSFGGGRLAADSPVPKCPKELELERVCRENYEAFPPGFDARDRRQKIETECQAKIVEATAVRDKIVEKATKKYEKDVVLAKQERDKRLEKDHAFTSAFIDLRDLKRGRGIHIHSTDFAAPSRQNGAQRKASIGKSAVDGKRRRDHYSPPPGSSSQKSSRASSVFIKESPRSPSSPLSMPTSTPVPKRPRLSDQGFQSSDVREIDRRAFSHSGGQSDYISTTAIRPQLSDKYFIWIPASSIHVKADRVPHMRRVVWTHTPGVPVHADSSGYFIIFENDDAERGKARACFERFNGERFWDYCMQMQLVSPGHCRVE